MKWNKSKIVLPENGLYMGMMPYLCCDRDKQYFLGYRKLDKWISYEKKIIIPTPKYWANIK